MKRIHIKKITAWSTILSAILFIVSIIGMQFYLAGDLNNIDQFLKNIINHSDMMHLYAWPGFMASILMIPIFYWMHSESDQRKDLSKIVLFISGIGITFILIAYLFQMTFTYFYAPIFDQVDSNQVDLVTAIIQTTVGLQDLFWLSGDLLAFLGIVFLNLISYRNNKVGLPLSILLSVAGIAAALGSFCFLPPFKSSVTLQLMFMLGFILFVLWEIIIGIKLLKSSNLES